MGLGAGFVPSSTGKRITEEKMGVNSLKLTEKAEIRPLGDTECIVRRHYAFLNRENSMIAKVINKQLIRSDYAAYLPATQGKGLLDDSHGTPPVSDGAATPEAVGGRDPAQA